MDQMSDSEQCSNQLQLDLILLLVNFLCELGQIMTRYDLLGARRVILSNVQTDSQLELISILVNFSYELGQIGGSFEKSGAKICFSVLYCSELGRKMIFAIQKANLIIFKVAIFL